MAKAKDFNKIGNNAVSKFLSNTENTSSANNTDNTPITHNEGIEQIEFNTHNTNNEQNTSIIHNTDNKQDVSSIDKETKSKRLNLLIQPSLFEDIKKVAYIEKLSANELIIRLIKDYTEQPQQQEKIKKYNEL